MTAFNNQAPAPLSWFQSKFIEIEKKIVRSKTTDKMLNFLKPLTMNLS